MANAKKLRGVGGRRNAWGVGVTAEHVVRQFARLLYKQVTLPKFPLLRPDYQNGHMDDAKILKAVLIGVGVLVLTVVIYCVLVATGMAQLK